MIFLSFLLSLFLNRIWCESLHDIQKRRYFEHLRNVQEKIIDSHRREKDDHPPFSKPVYHPFESDGDLFRFSNSDPFGFDHSDMKPLSKLYEQKQQRTYPSKGTNERRSLLDDDTFRFSKHLVLEEEFSKAKSAIHVDVQVHRGTFNLDYLQRTFYDEFSVLSCHPHLLKVKVLKDSSSYNTFVEYFIPGTRFSTQNCGEVVTYSMVYERIKLHEDERYITLIFKTQPLTLREFFMELKMTFLNDLGKSTEFPQKSESRTSTINVDEENDNSSQNNERRLIDTSGVWDMTISLLHFNWNYIDPGLPEEEYSLAAKKFHKSDYEPIATCFNCFAYFDSGIYIRLEYSFIDLDRFNVEFFGELKLALGIKFNFTGEYEASIPVYPLPPNEGREILKTFTFSIYGFPIIIDVCFDGVEIRLVISALAPLQVMEQFLLDSDVKFGYLYDEENTDNEHSVYKEFSFFYDLSAPQIVIGNGVVTFRASVVPTFSVIVQKICPVIFSPIPYFEFDLMLDANNRSATLTPYWGIDLEVGVDPLEFFGLTFDLGGLLPWSYTFELFPRKEISPCPFCEVFGNITTNIIRWFDHFNESLLIGFVSYNDGERFLRSGETRTFRLYASLQESITFRFLQRNTNGRETFEFFTNLRQRGACPYDIRILDGENPVLEYSVNTSLSVMSFVLHSSQLSSSNTYLEFSKPESYSVSDKFCGIDLNVYISFESSEKNIFSHISENEMLFYDLTTLAAQYILFTYTDHEHGMIFFGKDDDDDGGEIMDFTLDRNNLHFLTNFPSLGINTEYFEDSIVGLYSPYNQTFTISVEDLLPCDVIVSFAYTDEKLKDKDVNLLDIQYNGINITLSLPNDCLGQDFTSHVFQSSEILQIFLDSFDGGSVWKQMVELYIDEVTPFLFKNESNGLDSFLGEYISYMPKEVVFLFPPVGQTLQYTETSEVEEKVILVTPLPSQMFVSGDDRNGVSEGSGEMSITSTICMNNCNNRGVCLFSRCCCFPGFTGRQCQISVGIQDALPLIILGSILFCMCLVCLVYTFFCIVICFFFITPFKGCYFCTPYVNGICCVTSHKEKRRTKTTRTSKNRYGEGGVVSNELFDMMFTDLQSDLKQELLSKKNKDQIGMSINADEDYNKNENLMMMKENERDFVDGDDNDEEGEEGEQKDAFLDIISVEESEKKEKKKKNKTEQIDDEGEIIEEQVIGVDFSQLTDYHERREQHVEGDILPPRRKTWDEIMQELEDAKRENGDDSTTPVSSTELTVVDERDTNKPGDEQSDI